MTTPNEKTLALYEKVVATIPAVERKGKTTPYTSMNGHMFSFMTKEGDVALRLPDDAREAFAKKNKTDPVIQNGRVMKEYVLVPTSMLSRTAALAKHFAVSAEYVASLKPKATKRVTKKK